MTKNSMHYSGITPEDDTNGESPNVTEIGPATCSSSPASRFPTTPPHKGIFTVAYLITIFFFFFFLILVFIAVASSSASKSNRSSVTRNDGFDTKKLFLFLVNDPDNERAVIGSSFYPAILLYRYDKSDQIFGHIPHGWVNTDEPFLMVDQITMGVGECCRAKKQVFGSQYLAHKNAAPDHLEHEAALPVLTVESILFVVDY
jgi:hypothetical protein